MADREKVIKAIDICLGHGHCNDCEYHSAGHYTAQNCRKQMMIDVLALLKEDCHNCKLECLLQKYDQLKEKYDKLLKEQEAKPDKCIICEGCGHKLQDNWNWCPWCRWETARGRQVRSDGF